MKTIFSILALVLMMGSFPTSAFATCDQTENQFFGVVRNVQQVKNMIGEVSCTYQLTVNGTPSGVCPLSDARAETLVLLDATCAKKNGDKVSGILVTKSWIE
ncbi:hypothetical protein BH10BDE1_BH10BDE1_35420 [soil metagenome]